MGQWGIRVLDDGPWEMGDGVFNWNKIPVPTDLCDLCTERVTAGREPVCVHHCLGNVMLYGSIEELSKKLAEKPKQVLFVPQFKPLEAKGKFVPQNKYKEGRHKFAAIEVQENTEFSTSTQRSDSRTDLGMEKE